MGKPQRHRPNFVEDDLGHTAAFRADAPFRDNPVSHRAGLQIGVLDGGMVWYRPARGQLPDQAGGENRQHGDRAKALAGEPRRTVRRLCRVADQRQPGLWRHAQ